MRIESQKFSIFNLLVAAVIVIVSAVIIAVMPRAQAAPASGERLITIHDNGEETGLITRATTLRDVFKQANIVLDKNDVVEPGLDEQLVGNNYQVNVYRARPVVIVDGMTKQLVMTAYQTPKQIAKQAGIHLHDEDTAILQLTDNLLADGASERMTIDRATKVRLVLYGEAETAYTQASTVADFLTEKSISLEAKDKLSASKQSAIKAGMKIEVWREGKQVVTREETIKPPVRQIQDADREVGYRKVKTAGTSGKKLVTYQVYVKNGEEVRKKAIKTVVLKKAVEQVVVVGTKTKSVAVSGSCSDWMAAAGIKDTANATYLINAESGCNPNAVNASSGACGVGQALPCSKTGCAMGDGACQTKWMNSYVLGRYGSWAAAADHHRTYGWY